MSSKVKVTHRLNLRVSEKDRERIIYLAEMAGCSTSEYLRTCALNHEIKVTRRHINNGLINELRKIGNNLNQLTHAANSRRSVDQGKLHEILKAIEGAIKKM